MCNERRVRTLCSMFGRSVGHATSDLGLRSFPASLAPSRKALGHGDLVSLQSIEVSFPAPRSRYQTWSDDAAPRSMFDATP